MRHRLALTSVDLMLVACASFGAQLLRDNFEIRAEQLGALLPYVALTLVAALVAIFALDLNRSIWRLSGMADYLRAVGAGVATVVLAVVLGFLFNRLDGIARSLPVIQGFLIVGGLVGVRVTCRLHYAARKSPPSAGFAASYSTAQETILLVGIGPITELYLRCVGEFAQGTIKVGGLLAGSDRQTGRSLQGHAIVGTPEQVTGILADLAVHGLVINRIVVTVPFDRLSDQARAALLEVERSTDVKLEFFADNIGVVGRPVSAKVTPPPGLGDGDAFTCAIDADELSVLLRRPYWRAKRAIDAVVAGFTLVVALPLFVVVAVLVALDCGLPIMFWQYRPGARGRPFRLVKFRTMSAAHAPDGRRIPDNERLSIIGYFLRCSRLDELPQLFCILVGTMSFVGPRPLLPVDQCSGMPERLAIRPGLTGWAQVKGGRELTPADKAALDLWYLKNACLRVDLLVLVATLKMMVMGELTDRAAIQQAWRELGHSGAA